VHAPKPKSRQRANPKAPNDSVVHKKCGGSTRKCDLHGLPELREIHNPRIDRKAGNHTPQAVSEFRVYSPIHGSSHGKIPLVSQDLPGNLFTPRTPEMPVLLTNQTPEISGGDNSKVSEKIPEPAVSR
jgi:hypothetical protein